VVGVETVEQRAGAIGGCGIEVPGGMPTCGSFRADFLEGRLGSFRVSDDPPSSQGKRYGVSQDLGAP
jgi:hypothetical protein